MENRNQRTQVQFVCDCCGKEATKAKSEYERNIRLGKKNFAVGVAQLSIITHIELSLTILIIVYLSTLTITEMNLHHLDILLDVPRGDIKDVHLLLKIYKSNGNSNKEYVLTLN